MKIYLVILINYEKCHYPSNFIAPPIGPSKRLWPNNTVVCIIYINIYITAIIDSPNFPISPNDALKEPNIFPNIPDATISNSFGHIFSGGYSAGYYSYKWAEVLEADAFQKFKEDGIFNKATAQSFRDNILSQGSLKHPMELYKGFRGREPEVEALLKKDKLM